jgi:PAS domain S-box-containing protein
MVKQMNRTLSIKPAAAGPAGLGAIDELPLRYIELDTKGIITRANRTSLAAHPPEQGSLIGTLGWSLLTADEGESSWADDRAMMESGGEAPVAYRSLYDPSGKFRIYALHRFLIRDAEGKITGMRMLGVDMTEEREAYEEAQHTRLWLERVIASLADAVIVTDVLGFILSVNPAAEELTGWKEAELIGKVIDEAMPMVKTPLTDSIKADFRTILEDHKHSIMVILGRERRELRVEITTSPIVNRENDTTEGVVIVLRRVEDAA